MNLPPIDDGSQQASFPTNDGPTPIFGYGTHPDAFERASSLDALVPDFQSDSACYTSSTYSYPNNMQMATQTPNVYEQSRKRAALESNAFPNKRFQPTLSDELAKWNDFLHGWYVKSGRLKPDYEQLQSFTALTKIPGEAIERHFNSWIEIDHSTYEARDLLMPSLAQHDNHNSALQGTFQHSQLAQIDNSYISNGSSATMENLLLDYPLSKTTSQHMEYITPGSTIHNNQTSEHIASTFNSGIGVIRPDLSAGEWPNSQNLSNSNAHALAPYVPPYVTLNSALIAAIEKEVSRRHSNQCMPDGKPQHGDYYCTLGCARQYEYPSGLKRHLCEFYPQEFWFCEFCANSDKRCTPLKYLCHRSDKLHKHLREYHPDWPSEQALDACRVPFIVPMSGPRGCGFCDALQFDDWYKRYDHIIEHFQQEKKTLADWSQQRADCQEAAEVGELHPRLVELQEEDLDQNVTQEEEEEQDGVNVNDEEADEDDVDVDGEEAEKDDDDDESHSTADDDTDSDTDDDDNEDDQHPGGSTSDGGFDSSSNSKPDSDHFDRRGDQNDRDGGSGETRTASYPPHSHSYLALDSPDACLLPPGQCGSVHPNRGSMNEKGHASMTADEVEKPSELINKPKHMDLEVCESDHSDCCMLATKLPKLFLPDSRKGLPQGSFKWVRQARLTNQNGSESGKVGVQSAACMPPSSFEDSGMKPLSSGILTIHIKERVSRKGGTSSVFRALVGNKDTSRPSKLYAIKQYAAKSCSLFKQEFEALQKMKQHPSIVSLHGAFIQNNSTSGNLTYNLVLDLGEKDLNEYFETVPPPETGRDIAKMWNSLTQIADALQHIHQSTNIDQHGWHGDIKPDNIIFFRNQFKLADFGFSKFSDGVKTTSQPFIFGGTNAYSPPERNRTAPSLEPVRFQKHDIFSLGCVFSEMATWMVGGAKAVARYSELRHLHWEGHFYPKDIWIIPENRESRATALSHWHSTIRESTKSNDRVTASILDIVEDHMMQIEPSFRHNAKQICNSLEALSQKEERRLLDYLSPDVGLAADWSMIQNLMNHCQENHPKCARVDSSHMEEEFPYPLRLIDVESLRLRSFPPTQLHNLSYAALSYVWGQGRFLKLTTKNVSRAMERGFEPGSLPRTISDAVVVTHKLGISYLWVDALCIITDSVEDQSQNLRHMDLIYGKATLTLAAASGTSAASGLLPDLDKDMPMEVEPYPQTRNLDQTLWMRRGWTYQERLLSRRTLQFTEKKVFWECSTTSTDLCYKRLHSLRTPERLTLEQSVTSDLVRKAEGMFRWAALMLDYTKRDLTYESDRLAAIAGIAKRCQKQWALGNYYCGLWETELPRHLLWFSDRSKKSSHHYRATTWAVPSWSWAGVSGPIDNLALSLYRDDIKDSPTLQQRRYLLGICHVSITPPGLENSFSVTKATINVNGILHPILAGAELQRGQYALHRWVGRIVGAAFWDADEVVDPDEPLWICPVLQRETSEDGSWAACNVLVLRAARGNTSRDLVLQRVGMGRTTDFWRDGAVYQDFVLT